MKKTLMILCGLIMSLSAFAQTSVTVTEPHLSRQAKKTIIKECPDGYRSTITCSNSAGAVTFILSNNSMQAAEVTLEGYWVNDMEVTKDSVFFCGKQLSDELGIIGFFRIDTFFSNTGGDANITYNYLAGYANYPVNELTRIEIYTDPMNLRHAFCIGTCGEGYPCLVDKFMPINSYWAGYVNNRDEVFTDVKLVSSISGNGPYLATVGYDLTYGKYLSIRLYGATSVFNTGGPQDWCNIYCYESGSYARQWLDGGILLSHIDNNTFATISFRSDKKMDLTETDITKYKDIHLSFFDINSIISSSVYSMIDNYEISAPVNQKQEMNQFIHNNIKDAFAFLYSDSSSVSGEYESKYCEVFKNSLSTSGSLQAYTNPGTRQYGLARYSYWNSYILSGHDISDPRVLNYQMNRFGVLSNCAEPLEFKYNQENTVDAWILKREFSSKMNQCDLIKVTEEPEFLPLYIECETE